MFSYLLKPRLSHEIFTARVCLTTSWRFVTAGHLLRLRGPETVGHLFNSKLEIPGNDAELFGLCYAAHSTAFPILASQTCSAMQSLMPGQQLVAGTASQGLKQHFQGASHAAHLE